MKKLLLLLILSTSLSTFAEEYFDVVKYLEMQKLDFTLSDFCYLQPDVQERFKDGNLYSGTYYFPNQETGITATSIC